MVKEYHGALLKISMSTQKHLEDFQTVYKLKHEHIYLTSFSKMRVDLAAQVCLCKN